MEHNHKPSPLEKLFNEKLFNETPSLPVEDKPSVSTAPRHVARVTQYCRRLVQRLRPPVYYWLLFLVLAGPVYTFLLSPSYTLMTETYGAYQFLQQEAKNKARARELLETNAYPEITSAQRRGPMSREMRDTILPKSYAEQVNLLREWFSFSDYFQALGVENKNHGWDNFFNYDRKERSLSEIMLLLHYYPEAFLPQAELDLLPLTKSFKTEDGRFISHHNDLKQVVAPPAAVGVLDWHKQINTQLAHQAAAARQVALDARR